MTETISRYKYNIDIADIGYTTYPLQILEISTYQVFHPEKRKGRKAEISYRLTKDGYIRIRVVRSDNKKIILHNLLSWQKKTKERHFITWDIKDSAGTLLDPHTFYLSFQTKDEDDLLLHREHDIESCQDPVISLKLKDSDKTNGDVRVCATFENEPFRMFAKKGYRAFLFVESKLIKEKVYKIRPDLFEFNIPKSLLRKRKLITLNINDNYGHVGAASICW